MAISNQAGDPQPTIERIVLKFGSSESSVPLSFAPGSLTVLVGPNNSGKSLFLRELKSYCANSAQPFSIIHDVSCVEFATIEEFEKWLKPAITFEDNGQWHILQQNNDDKNHTWQATSAEAASIRNAVQDPNNRRNLTRAFLGSFHSITLNGQTRLKLVEEQESSDLSSWPRNFLVRLFQDPVKRKRLRDLTYDALKFYCVIDPTAMTKFRIRLSPRAPVDEAEEQSLDSRARAFHAQATDIRHMSDGVKSFVGVLAALLSGAFQLILIDEPEAFLHPPLARKLGRCVAQQASGTSSNVFVSTHSADFLMGCIESGVPVNILRLTYRNGSASARLLESAQLARLMLDPLIRSTNFLESIFYDGVIITEADADRAFYQEINFRLLSEKSGGSDDTLFINAQNKQTICRLMKPIREMGVPAAGVIDLDFFKEGGTVLNNILDAAMIPSISQSGFGQMRGQLKAAFDSTGKDMKKDGGVDILPISSRTACYDYIEQLARYGLFLVSAGELESWLKSLDIRKRKSEWLIDIFEKMGMDPDDQGYIRPGLGDVWDFMRQIAKWINDPKRSGIPSE